MSECAITSLFTAERTSPKVALRSCYTIWHRSTWAQGQRSLQCQTRPPASWHTSRSSESLAWARGSNEVLPSAVIDVGLSGDSDHESTAGAAPPTARCGVSGLTSAARAPIGALAADTSTQRNPVVPAGLEPATSSL